MVIALICPTLISPCSISRHRICRRFSFAKMRKKSLACLACSGNVALDTVSFIV
ncbi:hypothetical protein [Moraxella lacunata]|uniref:hypothetical protein n=1 Tax=Moraxella lacunata TaxID=477 RepID=UPI003EE09A25